MCGYSHHRDVRGFLYLSVFVLPTNTRIQKESRGEGGV